jgi:hypothetical protein
MYLSIKQLQENLPQYEDVIYVPFVAEHAFSIEGGEFSGYSTQKLVGIQRMLETQAEYGFAVTCFYLGEPVACFGTTLLWNGVGEMWSVIGDLARTRPLAMTRIARSFSDISEIALGLHRLQITVKTSDNRAMKWARAIGFISEGTLKAYSMDKEDYNMMAKAF